MSTPHSNNYAPRGQRRASRPSQTWPPMGYYDHPEADTSGTEAGSTSQQPLRAMSMNAYGAPQPQSRPAPRLQNVNKSGLGNGAGAGWGGFGIPGSGGGFGALGGAPGLGQGRPGQLLGFAQVMGGGGGQGPIDMSDFPSLSGGPRPQQNNANSAGWNSNAIRQPSAQQQPLGQQSQQRAPSAAPSQQSLDQFDNLRSQPLSAADRAGSGDDFPPLGGQMNGDGFGQPNGLSSAVGSPDMQQPRLNGQQSQLPIRQGSDAFQQTPGLLSNQHPSQPPPQPSQNGQQQPPPSNIKRYADMTEAEKWGMPGLMAGYEARRQAEIGGPVDDTLPPIMRNPVIMGHDLSTLGMDLDSPEPLHPTFFPFPAAGSSGSELNFHERQIVPDFTLPNAYTVNNVPPLSGRIRAFADETLFSIFYQNPRDILQELAAQELMSRDWRWHKVLHQWLQKDSPTASSTNASSSALPLRDLTNGHPIGVLPVRLNDRGEKGVYVFFDAMNWRRERRWLELDYEHLDPPRGSALVNGAAPVVGGPVGRGLDGVGQVPDGMGAGSASIPRA